MDTICDTCVMDSTAVEFKKIDKGCVFCRGMLEKQKYDGTTYNLDELIYQIKTQRKSSRFDCLIGLSGGVDSAYVLHKAVENGLRPLVVHIDNGWNTALSQHNLEKLVIGSKAHYISNILYWPEYKEHLRALIQSNVVDLELLADNIMNKIILETAIKYKVKIILNGVNTATEGIALPRNWAWNKLDGLNLHSILKKHSKAKMNCIRPIMPSKFYLLQKAYGIQNVPFLNYIRFSKKDALSELKERYKFVPYKYKHYENIFTRFYQGYILPEKFQIDKRKMHLSALILSGELQRLEALKILETSPYPSESLLLRDKRFVAKKLEFPQDFFDSYTQAPGTPHTNYKSNLFMLKSLKNLLKLEVGFNR